MNAIMVLTRRYRVLKRGLETGDLDQAQCEEQLPKVQEAISDHLIALDEERWLDWCAGELESANLTTTAFGQGMID